MLMAFEIKGVLALPGTVLSIFQDVFIFGCLYTVHPPQSLHWLKTRAKVFTSWNPQSPHRLKEELQSSLRIEVF